MWAAAVLLLVPALAVAASPATGSCAAPGAARVISSAEHPGYTLNFAVRPPEPAVGNLQLIVQLCDMQGGAVPGASVTLVPINPKGVRGAPVLAFNRSTDPGEYTAGITVRQPGTWRYLIRVASERGDAAGEGEFEVRGASPVDFGPGIVFGLVSVALLLGTGYLVWDARRARPPHPSVHRRGRGER